MAALTLSPIFYPILYQKQQVKNMTKKLIAGSRVTIQSLNDAYTITQSLSSYVFATSNDGTIVENKTITSAIKVMMGDVPFTDFTIGTISKPSGFSAITINNTDKALTYIVTGGTSTLADSGIIDIPIIIAGNTYYLSFAWSKAKQGIAGPAGVDANLLDWVSDWNSGKTVIGAQSIITPKIFAGVKNPDGTLTGIALGRFTLNTRNESGIVVTETIDGMYGFKDGYKTFFVNNSGSAGLGRGNQYVRYNSDTGKIEFGSEVSLNWLTPIANAKNEAINTASVDARNRINNIQSGGANLVSKSRFENWSGTHSHTDYGFKADNVQSNGIRFLNAIFKPYSDYYLSFKIRKTDGSLTQIGGHTGSFVSKKVIVDNVEQSYEWRAPIPVNSLNDGEWHKVELLFSSGSSLTDFLYIQPNRSIYSLVSCEVDGLNIREGNMRIDWSASPDAIDSKIEEVKTIGEEAQAVADAITQQANTENWGTKLTHIDANGIFTGTLAANTVNSVRLNASQITAGIIDTARLNVTELKTMLITASNIESLTLHVIKGQIGGWKIDSDSIYTGTKNNVSGIYTSSQGFITIGTNGIRGYQWKLEANGSGALAGGNISWDMYGNVIFGESVQLNWANPINSIVSALGGSSYQKLTQISSTGIYTGSLNANQITAGSILASQLDAASIRAGIINTDYINGLSCTFDKGTIGGWKIGNDNITSGNLGAIGEIPIQIRSTSAGSGYWYNCGYKPYGMTLTWYQTSNAGHFVFGQVAASGNTVKTGFIGIQMMSWDHKEYFCLSANHAVSGTKEIYNRIAGWAFDSEKIWKNNVSLGADGSVVNGTKWKLNNDGSGSLAEGNISWDVSGNVSFGNSVVLNWTAPINNVVSALGGSSYPKLTQISSTGIYTGTLNANQITAGSILASQLDAASIKTGIINTDYINGLSCTFVQGLIGGWTIAADSIYNRKDGKTIMIRSKEEKSSILPDYGRQGITLFLEDSLIDSESVKIVQMGVLAKTGTISSYDSKANYGFRIALKDGTDIFRADKKGIVMGGWNVIADTIYSRNNGKNVIIRSGEGGSTIMPDYGRQGVTIYIDDSGLAAGGVKIVQMGSLPKKNTTKTYESTPNYGFRVMLKSGKDVFRADSYGAVISGWSMDEDSIYNGTKNNISGGYTSGSGYITIGSAGIRGYRWRLDADGAGALAGGNIFWDASGYVTFGSSVSLNWTKYADDKVNSLDISGRNYALDTSSQWSTAVSLSNVFYITRF